MLILLRCVLGGAASKGEMRKTIHLNERQDKIFDIIVRSYIETAEPVGSRTISRQFDVDLSPASIRNVMADLEEQGLIRQPHTSAGRIPTDKGYRYYIDRLMPSEELTKNERAWIEEEIGKGKTIESIADRVGKVISEMTQNAAMVYIKNLKRVSFLNHFLDELVESDALNDFFEEEPELFVDGAFRVFEQPEFQDAKKMLFLLQALDQKINFYRILTKSDDKKHSVHVHIGRENENDNLRDVSLVVKDCYLGNTPIGGVAVLGPTRMRYSKIVAVVEYAADRMSHMAERF